MSLLEGRKASVTESMTDGPMARWTDGRIDTCSNGVASSLLKSQLTSSKRSQVTYPIEKMNLTTTMTITTL